VELTHQGREGAVCRKVLSWGPPKATASQEAALTTITPCASAPLAVRPVPITVTSPYQLVSTCEEQRACLRGKCSARYTYSTYSYVSTVIPCPYATASATTVTRVDQPVIVSRAVATITRTTEQKITKTARGSTFTHKTTLSAYTTLAKEWSVLYKNLGPLALPNYDGSGLCTDCQGPKKERQQTVTMVECASSRWRRVICRERIDIWIENSASVSTWANTAVCSSQGAVSTAGVYTFAFPQRGRPRIAHIPARTYTITKTQNRQPATFITTVPETTTVLSEEDWTAYITRRFARPTNFKFQVTVTTTITITMPYFVLPGST
jgi:hypothetical protein